MNQEGNSCVSGIDADQDRQGKTWLGRQEETQESMRRGCLYLLIKPNIYRATTICQVQL